MAIKNLSALKKTLKGFDVDALLEAIKSTEEVEVSIPDVLVVTNAELSVRDEQIKATNINVGKELLIKELKTKAGLDYTGEGSKDPDKFISEYAKKVSTDLGKSEEEKVKELNSVVEKLRKNLEQEQKEKTELITSQKQSAIKQKYIENTIDKKPDNYTNEEWITLLSMGVQIEEVDGVEVVKKGGEILRDKITQKPLPIKDALSSYIDERKLGKTIETTKPNGRGGVDSKTPSYTGIANMRQYMEHLKTNGISENGQQAATLLKDIVDTNPNFDFSTK